MSQNLSRLTVRVTASILSISLLAINLVYSPVFAQKAPDHNSSLAEVKKEDTVYRDGDYQKTSAGEPVAPEDIEPFIRSPDDEEAGRLQKLEQQAKSAEKNGLFEEAAQSWGEQYDLLKKSYGAGHPYAGVALAASGMNLSNAGEYAQADMAMTRALDVIEKALGAEHPETISALNNLAINLDEQGRFAEAKILKIRVLESCRKIFGEQHARSAGALNDLALSIQREGDIKTAEKYLAQAVGIFINTLGREHNDTMITLGNHAGALSGLGRFDEALRKYAAVVELSEKIHGTDHPATALSLNNYAFEWALQKRYDKAIPLFQRAIDIRKKSLGPTHPLTAATLETMAIVRHRNNEPAQALDNAREALSTRLTHAKRNGVLSDDNALTELASRAAWRVANIAFETSVANEAKGDLSISEDLKEEAFIAAQYHLVSPAGNSLLRTIARSSADASQITELARAWERSLDALEDINEQYYDLSSDKSALAIRRRNDLATRRDALNQQIERQEALLRSDFSSFFGMINPEPLSIQSLQSTRGEASAILKSDEALILLMSNPFPDVIGSPGIVWAITKDNSAWAKIGLPTQDLNAAVIGLRTSLDLADQFRASDESDIENVSAIRRGFGFDRARARALYQALFGADEIAAVLEGKPKWIIAPQGSLLSVPYNALVTDLFEGDDRDPDALRRTPWLGVQKAISIMPSLSSLYALRVLERPARNARSPFFGVGAPVFGIDGDTESDDADDPESTPLRAAMLDGSSFYRDGRGDVDMLRMLPSLPSTGPEIRALATSLGAGRKSFLLGKEATETNLRRKKTAARLKQARIVAFATHGLLAGDLAGSLAEPALALSPPEMASEADDGLLTASEIAVLELSAEWVILSACNTAAGETPDANGLTGLARAFFYAGAESLLVSNWRIEDDAAAKLTTRTLALLTENPKLNRAEALKASMRELMLNKSKDDFGQSFAHPSQWAPFMLVGAE